MSGTVDKGFRPIVRQLRELGYTVQTKGHRGHAKVFRPNGSFICPIPGSSSDVRAVRNFVSQLRRHGVPL